MGSYCRRVGYLYSNLNTLPECVGCVKAIFCCGEMRVCVCLTGKRLRCGETKLYLLLQTASGPVTCLLDEFFIRPNVREYCFQHCPERQELPRGEAVGFLLLTEGQTLGCAFDGRNLNPSVWLPRPEPVRETQPQRDAEILEDANGLCGREGVNRPLEGEDAADLESECPAEDTVGSQPENPLERHLCEQEKTCEAETEELRAHGEPPFALCVEELFRKRPVMQPFLKCEFEHCIRISLSDLQLLRDAVNIGAGNSFLCHSYYRYRHLLLAKKAAVSAQGEEASGERELWLLAPGIGNNRERQMSELYGFTAFRSIHGNRCGGYGYWCMQLFFRPQTDAESLEKIL